MKPVLISVFVTVGLIVGIFYLVRSTNIDVLAATQNVQVIDGTQYIEISARGGYVPRKSVAKSGIPTVIRFDTNGTFDCSATVRIPSIGINKTLPMTGVTDIAVGTFSDGALTGTCGMGMYNFEVDFES